MHESIKCFHCMVHTEFASFIDKIKHIPLGLRLKPKLQITVIVPRVTHNDTVEEMKKTYHFKVSAVVTFMCQNIHGSLLYKNIEKTPTISEIWREGKRERKRGRWV